MRTITQFDVWPERLYQPFVVPEQLDELAGPTSGSLLLPRNLAWNGRREFQIDDRGQLIAAYDRILPRATADQLRRWVSAELIADLLPCLHIDPIVRRAWLEVLEPSGIGRLGTIVKFRRKHLGGTEICRARAAAGLTQDEFAQRVDMTLAEVAELEAGRRSPSVDFLMRVAEVCGPHLRFK